MRNFARWMSPFAPLACYISDQGRKKQKKHKFN